MIDFSQIEQAEEELDSSLFPALDSPIRRSGHSLTQPQPNLNQPLEIDAAQKTVRQPLFARVVRMFGSKSEETGTGYAVRVVCSPLHGVESLSTESSSETHPHPNKSFKAMYETKNWKETQKATEEEEKLLNSERETFDEEFEVCTSVEIENVEDGDTTDI